MGSPAVLGATLIPGSRRTREAPHVGGVELSARPQPVTGDVPEDQPIQPRILVVLALCGGFAPFAIDAYLPGLPAIADEFSVDASIAQLTLTGFLVALGLMQLVIGPLSDQLGRRRLLLIGLTGSLIASIACALAPNIWVLIVARVFQGAFGAAGVVLSRAIVADLGRGVGVAKAFAMLMSIQSLAPIIAPLVGGLIVPTLGWRAVYWFLAGLGITVLIAAFFVVSESLPREHRRAGGVRSAVSDMLALQRSPLFVAPAAMFVVTFAVMFAYVSAAPFVLQRIVGLSEGWFSVVFTINSASILVANLTSARIVGRFGIIRIISVASVVFISVVAWLAVSVLVLGTPGWAVILGFFLLVFSFGFVLPNLAALAIGSTGDRSGSGSAMMGAGQFMLAAVVAPLTGIGDGTTAVPMVAVMVTAGIAVVVCLLVLRRAHGDGPRPGATRTNREGED